MMGAVTPYTKLKRPDDTRTNTGFFTPAFAEDDLDSLARARQGYVKNTGGKLGDVKNAGIYKNFTEAQKKNIKKETHKILKKKKKVLN